MSRVDEIQMQLESIITEAAPGSRIPPVRQLIKQLNTSIPTINKALEQFKREGRLRAIHGSGLYVTGDKTAARPAARRIDVVNIVLFCYVVPEGASSFAGSEVFHLTNYLTQAGFASTVTVLPPSIEPDEAAKAMAGLARQAVILVSPHQERIAQHLADEGVPYVCLGPAAPADWPHSLYFDNAAVMRLAFEHLIGLGHQRIAYLHGVTSSLYLRWAHERERFFYRECMRHGLTPDIRLLHFGGYSQEEGARATRELLASGVDFTAVIANDTLCDGVYGELRRAGRGIPGDVAVVGINDGEIARRLHPPLTAVRLSTEQLARRAVDALLARLAGKTPELSPLQPTLVARASTAPVAEPALAGC